MRFSWGAKMKWFCAALGLAALTFGTPVQASDATAGLISDISINSHSIVSFRHTGGNRGATPACHTAGDAWVFSVAAPNGQAKLSIILSAYALHKKIRILGRGTCADWGDTESVDVLFVVD
jgi:hypothetical protein